MMILAGRDAQVTLSCPSYSWLEDNPNYEGVVQEDLTIPLGTPKEGGR